MQRTDSDAGKGEGRRPSVKTLMLGKIERRRRKGQQRMRWLDGITDSMDMSLSKLREIAKQGSLACCSPWGHKESDTSQPLNYNTCIIEKDNTEGLCTFQCTTARS